MIKGRKEEWSYITLPNRMFELVKNTGNMNKIRVGYYIDAESEMLTILDYLNNGEKTNITESMIKQIDKAIRETITERVKSNINTMDTKISTTQFIMDYVELTNTCIAAIYYFDEVYTIRQYCPGNIVKTITRGTIIDSRKYLKERGYRVRYLRTEKDGVDLIEAWI